MSRSLGLVALLQELLPPELVPVVVAITTLGDVAVLLVVLTGLYWFRPEDRERAAWLLAIGLAALALTLGLKGLFGLARPPASLHLADAEGFGFPSGHALGSTVVWGGTALLGARWTRKRRLGLAGLLIGAISLSRVALGVHYLVDIVAGFAVGAALLVAGWVWLRDRPDLAMGLAVLLALGAGLAAGPTENVASALGGAVGGALAWIGRDSLPEFGGVAPTHALAVAPALGGLFIIGRALDPGAPVLFVLNAIVVGGVVATPAIGPWWAGRGD